MSFFWPTNLNPEPGVLARAGRVLHWIGLLLAGFWVVIAIVAAASDEPRAELLLLGLVGVPFALGGRGLRYILAGE